MHADHGDLHSFPTRRSSDLVSAPPFPDGRVIASRNAHAPLGAGDERGDDVLSFVSQADRKYVADFDDLPLAGFAKLHQVGRDLGAEDAHQSLGLLTAGVPDYLPG